MYEKILKKYQPDKDNLIYILHDIQDNDSQNYVSEEAVNEVSNYLNISQSHIYGVLTFYSMFSVKPRGKHIIRLCDSPPCFLKGSNKLYKKLSNILKIKNGQTTKDGKFTLELVACLGVCGNASVAMINNEITQILTEDKIEVIINKLNKGENNVS